ncbi:glutamate-5-semialdehyde dehydrogenase [Alistipes indistinctus]|uniref:glutamate-5-semialdehyde dehydrogenase n=1 Tax=Alistipes indistinctus TaxID=626932 RepID=UPI0036F27EBB
MELNETFNKAVEASRALNLTDVSRIDAVLLALADAAEAKMEFILEANRRDLALMDEQNPMYDRLMLTPKRIRGIAADIRNVASLPSPLGHVLDEVVRPNGMKITKISVPFGVIGVIYEARPNVSFDVVSLCLKSGNACVLKGGHDAGYSNEAIVKVIREVLQAHGMDEHTVTLLPADRAATAALLGAVGYIDLLIPRGSKGLIDYVRDNARIPVIETGAGICHTYFDAAGDRAKCADIVFNAKTRRVSVCNALDCLIVHRDRLGDLPAVCGRLAAKEVVIYADSDAYAVLDGRYPTRLLERATAESFGTEFLSYKMSIRTVSSLDEAIAHITRYSSNHSEAIVSENPAAVRLFQQSVDAACVYANVSTAFTDGAQFGLGAEIGISTQKLHARGPMALRELTSYKYLINGNGQTRA